MKYLILILINFLSFNCFALEKENLPQDLREMSKKGMDYIYSIELDKAQSQFEEIIKKYPEHPIGHFGIAMTKWAYYEYLEDQGDQKMDDEYANLTDKAIEIGKKWLKLHPNDATAHMCMGGMYGLRARLNLTQHSWLKAYVNGKRALSSMRKSLEIDDKMYDAYLGLGMYEYSAGTLPSVIRWLSKLLISGDAQKGIDYLKICKEKGYFNSIAAELILIEIFTEHDGKYANPKLAVEWSRELRKIYPYHAQMHFVEIVSLYEAKMYEEARTEMLEYLNRVGKYPHYKENYLSRIYTALGTIYMMEKNYDKALEYFEKAKKRIEIDKKASRWSLWAIVRIGNVYDMENLRDRALSYYKEALSYKDYWGFKEYIEDYIDKPFNISLLPVQLPPP